MQKERISGSGEGSAAPVSAADLAVALNREEAAVLDLLMAEQGPGLWSVDELARALGDRLQAVDGLRRLESYGLVHRLGDFVFPSRAAVRAEQIRI
jgi:predicted transcriptional regulator